jgi:hypothetical protein
MQRSCRSSCWAAEVENLDPAVCWVIMKNRIDKMCRLYLSIMVKMKVHMNEFGDANEQLTEL